MCMNTTSPYGSGCSCDTLTFTREAQHVTCRPRRHLQMFTECAWLYDVCEHVRRVAWVCTRVLYDVRSTHVKNTAKTKKKIQSSSSLQLVAIVTGWPLLWYTYTPDSYFNIKTNIGWWTWRVRIHYSARVCVNCVCVNVYVFM